MRFQLIGAAALARLMHDARAEGPDLAWLLHGPEDEDWVEPADKTAAPLLLAAE